ncbi:MAG: hypothetical protein AW07_02163 [Candidatus Accumulibacter sp. SK-11]|nr:MAG: hypothetical protein AW07_02163 [Candidatus Accumulibacter sp. SK-11]
MSGRFLVTDADGDLVPDTLEVQVGRPQAHRQFLCEDHARFGLQGGVGQRADALAAAVDTDAHAQSMQGLRQLQGNHPGTEHGDGLR